MPAYCSTEGMSTQEKNQLLVTVMQSLVGDREYQAFKEYSAKYRAGQIGSSEYYKHFFATFGETKQASELFLLLASLLPNPAKRMELLELHTSHATPPQHARQKAQQAKSPPPQQQQQQQQRAKGSSGKFVQVRKPDVARTAATGDTAAARHTKKAHKQKQEVLFRFG